MKRLALLGSTGSIGTQTLEIVGKNPSEFKVAGLTANNNVKLLKKQISDFNPGAVAVFNEEKAEELRKEVDIDVYSGVDGIIKIARLNDADVVVNSLVGSVGVRPTMEAIRRGKDVALANKEALVTAGSVVMEEAKKNNIKIMPVDSEHSAILQCLNGERKGYVERLIITASGGPFRKYKKEGLKKVTVEQALKHPNWKMGSKITVDSATLMNKGFEVIEARWLFNIPYEKIEVVVHPQSIIHSMVEFKDKSIMAQMGVPDMKIPIQYALAHPKRLNLNTKKLDLAEIRTLDFEKPDFEKFPCLKYAYEAGKTGGTMPAVLNAANEVAVQGFLKKEIKFLHIAETIKKAMDEHKLIVKPNLGQILEADGEARVKTRDIIKDIGNAK